MTPAELAEFRALLSRPCPTLTEIRRLHELALLALRRIDQLQARIAQLEHERNL